ncbi:YqcI/YcgG family protein [Kitasatospora sp. NPDC101176]|uniref:YqcI/YcgG family protein n=1 Tax=Kitasatospora sp. NPDC101176 TaxID=3364099 RepID=UPI0037F35510
MKLHVTRLQDAVHRLVEERGHYWAPLPTDAHLAAEVDALGRLAAGGADPAAAKGPLVEIVVAALALANAYGVSMQQACNDAAMPADLTDASLWRAGRQEPEQVAALVAAAVEPVHYTMAFYRSEARQGSDPRVVALHGLIPGVLRAAFAGFDSHDDLGAHLNGHLERTRTLDGRSRETEFDPSRAVTTELIRPIQMQTFCPFAQKSVLWGPPSYDEDLSFEDNMKASLPTLRQFIRVQDHDVIDGYVYAFPTRVFGESFEDLQQVFRNFVEFLHRNLTDAAPAGLDPETATDPKWFLVLEDEECFISVFAPIYPHDHSRYMNGVEGHFVFMLQPEAAVLRLLTKNDYKQRSEAIRHRFRDGFQRYVLADIELHRFLLPVQADQPPVKWYELAPTI